MSVSKEIKNKYQILCVDDEAEILSLYPEWLASTGYEILTLSSVDEVLGALKRQSHRVVAVISDFSMPQKTGFDLRQEMITASEELKAIPFIVISGMISREDALKAVELKIAAFISKPFKTEALLQVVESETKARLSLLRDEEEMLTGFVGDAKNLSEEMEDLILHLEDLASEPEALNTSLNRIFACAHTIKGSSGFFKPDTLHKFTHKYEDFFSLYKKKPETLNPSVISVLLKGLDTIKQLLVKLENREDLSSLSSEVVPELCKIFNLDQAPKVEGQQAEKNEVASSVQVQKNSGNTQVAKSSEKKNEIRISIDLLNEFMEKSGEITVLRNMVNKVLRQIELSCPGDPNVSVLVDLMSEMHKVVSSMQDQLTDLRKVPLKQVMKPLARTLRDLSTGLKKKINFNVSNDDLRVDHLVAETLGNCLIHMVRNSADHGIEAPEQRAAVGKPIDGKIELECKANQDFVEVVLSDDGRGIDPKKIGEKAIEKGVLTPERAKQMSDGEIQMLIFEPGFSTAEKITDVSGRGVGADMVKQTILSSGGDLKLTSVVGKGTSFRLKLPVPKSVMIISSLMIKAGGEMLALPQDQIRRVLLLSSEVRNRCIREVEGCYLYDDGNQLIPVLNLSESLKISISNSKETNLNSGALIVVESKVCSYCLSVDQILDIEEIVVKPIKKWANPNQVFLGATFLGDGRIGMIIDVDGLASYNKLGTKVTNIVNAQEQNIENKSSYLTFNLGTGEQFALLQNSIFRLEEFKSTDCQISGGKSVVIYRGTTVPLIQLSNVLLPKVEESLVQSDRVKPAIVIQQNSHLYAFSVAKIGDMIEASLQDDAQIQEEVESQSVILNDQIYTLVNLGSILKSAA